MSAIEREPRAGGEALTAYDAGLLSDHGGGNVEWWWDYLRAELARAHDFYQSQVDAQPPSATPAEIDLPALWRSLHDGAEATYRMIAGERPPAPSGDVVVLDSDTQMLDWLIRSGLRVHRMSDTGQWMVVDGDGHPTTGGEFGDPLMAIADAMNEYPFAAQPPSATPAEDADRTEWLDRLASALDRAADEYGWINLPDGRSFGSRQTYMMFAPSFRCPPAPSGDVVVPDGMVLAPRNPTDAMIRAGLAEIQQQAKYGNFACSTVYRAMLNAAVAAAQ